ncbi:MAG TPA: YihY/virulence factor BrkB family protein [Sphingomicrobium sp.]|nr:YihY/virulence factor BrkB family protein [Sphingomicrobium sp.]
MSSAAPAASAKDSNTGPATGREADSPLKIPARGWKQVATRTWKQSSEDNIGLVAAGVAFYGFLALVPLLGATVLTYGIIADPQTVVANVKSLTSVVPKDAAKLIGDQLMSVVQTSGGKKGIGLFLAIAVALFGARNAAGSVITALNIAYEGEETRGFLRVNLLSLEITAGAVLMAVVALLAIAALGYLEKLFPHAPSVLLALGKVISYVLLLLGAAAAAATLYRYGPNRRKAKWEWITPGTVFASVAWLILTFGFGFYVARFGNYNKTYGSLATVVILVTWMYLSAYVFLFGAELNSELEHQTAKDTTAGAAKPLGGRHAWSADHVAGSDEPSKPSGGDVSPPKRGEEPPPSYPRREPSTVDDYVAGRVANRAGAVAGMRSVGMVSAVLSTLGLSLLRKRGKAGAGVALVATAAGLSLLKRHD